MTDLVLIVDDDPGVRQLLVTHVESLEVPAATAESTEEALRLLHGGKRPSLVLSDVNMPGATGLDLLREIKALDSTIQVVMVSGLSDIVTMRECLRQGAYDYLTKPIDMIELANTVTRALERHRLVDQNRNYRENLERMVQKKTLQLTQTRDIALLTLAKLAESRDTETGLHLERITAFCRCLATTLREGPYAEAIDESFIAQIEKSSALHDIGKVGIPDSILLKPGPLSKEQWKEMQRHPTIGGDTIRSVIEQYEGHTFLLMAMEIAYSHHEKWDGAGYPEGLVGNQIPLAARIVALTDAYDALTSQRPYKEAWSHEEALDRIEIDRGAHFDPIVTDAFLVCHEEFRVIRASLVDIPDHETDTAAEE